MTYDTYEVIAMAVTSGTVLGTLVLFFRWSKN